MSKSDPELIELRRFDPLFDLPDPPQPRPPMSGRYAGNWQAGQDTEIPTWLRQSRGLKAPQTMRRKRT